MTWAWKQELSTGPKFVLIALADNANSDGLCYPGQDSIAEKCGMTDRTVRNSIKTLIDSGIITKQHRQKASGKGRTSDLYQIMIPGAKSLYQPENISALSNADQQENISGRNPVDNLQNKPEEFSGRCATNRKNFPDQPEEFSGSSNNEYEPSVEPSVAETRTRGDNLANVLGQHFPPHKIQNAKTIPMLRRWARDGITPEQLTDAINIATAKLGDVPGHPSYLDPIVQELANPVAPTRKPGMNRQAALEASNREAIKQAIAARQQREAVE